MMKECKLEVICGLKILDAAFVEGDAGISFENGISIAIYNQYKFDGCVLDDGKSLIGNIVIRVDEGIDVITIEFSNNCVLHIDMRNDAYTGPEAMQLRVPNEPIVVWN